MKVWKSFTALDNRLDEIIGEPYEGDVLLRHIDIWSDEVIIEVIIRFASSDVPLKFQKKNKDSILFKLYISDFLLKVEGSGESFEFGKIIQISDREITIKLGKYIYNLNYSKIHFCDFNSFKYNDLIDMNW